MTQQIICSSLAGALVPLPNNSTQNNSSAKSIGRVGLRCYVSDLTIWLHFAHIMHTVHHETSSSRSSSVVVAPAPLRAPWPEQSLTLDGMGFASSPPIPFTPRMADRSAIGQLQVSSLDDSFGSYQKSSWTGEESPSGPTDLIRSTTHPDQVSL